ncbi:MAG: Crp/Fnr family transcriptional regulator [Chitinophagales bacterium]
MQQHPICTHCDSKKCFINRFVAGEWKEKLASGKTVQRYKSGKRIFTEGDPVNGIYFIYSGKVKVFNTGPDGRYQIVRLAGSGEILGHRGLGLSMNYPISAIALEDAIICFIKTEDFLMALEHNAAFSINLLMFYASELRRAEYKLRSLSQMTVKQKLADALLTIRDIYGVRKGNGKKELAVKLSRQEYADIVGASIEEVIRTFSQLKKEGLILLEGKYVIINKEKELEKLLTGFRNIMLP